VQVDWYFDFVSPYSYLQCERLGVADAEARISDPAVKEELRRNGEGAIAAGVFGVPTLAIDGELFWGYDATDMALDYLRDPVAFVSEEIRRVDQLPYGATRL
jgi:2-hydroxychromene-2-carboxylate isomerase